MGYRNELLDGLVGGPVVLGHLKAPDLDEDAAERMRSDPGAGRSELVQSLRASFELVGYDEVGLTLRHLAPRNAPFFVPWGAVLKIEKGFEDHEDLIGRSERPADGGQD